jgi:hypothetical protein
MSGSPIWWSPESVNSLISTSSNFDTIRKSIENGPHGIVHTTIGGRCPNGGFSDMGGMYSPYDPVY